ncbi:putative snf2-related protein [Eutypa lata UCREL1]|uniref:Putative snf2-related protein n=1 Tax=Eutypa lata (strain UCR-EL1) TaxID=1287681 RepID=M7T543_EUTLA|nr:putative snf2-related protein [Eutypa lata UCREL1]
MKAAKSLVSPRRWCLTGTPIQNRIEDLTSLLKFLHFEPFAQSHAFMRYILDPLSKDTPNRTFSLQALLHTICLRRTEKLLDLPTPHFEKIVVRMCTEETSLYSEIVKKCARDVDEVVSTKKKKIKKYNVLFTAMMRLRRLCNHGTFPVCVPASTSSPSTSKIDAELESTLDLLEQHLQSKHIDYLRIDGRVKFEQRLLILQQFRESNVPVLLMSIQTGALGLNLTVASYVHIVEPQWNPSVEEQAIARAVRMGQTRSVTIIRYVVKNSVEENIVNLQKRKRNLAKFTLDERPRDGGNENLEVRRVDPW